MNEKVPDVLPFTRLEDMKKPKWSLLYAYNLRVIRDIFVYCSKKIPKEKDLYIAMEESKIPPPRDRWIAPHIKRKERLRLEYVHASEYLGFIKREKGLVKPNILEFKKEKEIILKENSEREFKPADSSPALTEKEKKALLSIILNYERARDFLRWFLDFSKFPTIWSFNLDDFKNEARPILLEKIKKGKKGSEIIKREIDSRVWRIPKDYVRLASFVFPAWFKELGVIDEVIVFPEFSEDKKLWYMYYPIKISEEEFLKLDMFEILESMFSEENRKSVWIPYLLYFMARKYNCPLKAIKRSVESVYKKYFEYLYLERTPLHLMKRQHKESYIKVEGFFRSYLSMTRRRECE